MIELTASFSSHPRSVALEKVSGWHMKSFLAGSHAVDDV